MLRALFERILLAAVTVALAVPAAVPLAVAQGAPAASPANDRFLADQIAAVRAAADSARAAPAQPAASPETPAARSTAEARLALGRLAVSVEPVSDGMQLRFPWDRLVPAAVVQRGDVAWVVFGEARLIDHSAVTPVFQRWLARPEQITHAGATVLRYRLRPDTHVGMQREGLLWTLTIKNAPIVPRSELQVESRRDPLAGSQRFLPASGVGQSVVLRDPDMGDTLMLSPITDSSAGVFTAREFPDGLLLATAQGVALVPLGNRTGLVQTPTGVAVVVAAGGADVGPVAPAAALGGATPVRMLDLAAWRTPLPGTFQSIRADLLHKLSMAPEADRQSRRFALARFFLGHGFNADALGVLQRMVRIEPTLVSSPQFRAARGLAALELNQLDLAVDDLTQLSLDISPEIWLLRTRMYEAIGRPQEALQAFARGADIIGKLDPAARAAIQLAAIRAAIETGALPLAARELDLVPATGTTLAQRAEAEFLRGRLALLQGKSGVAAARFNAVQAMGDRRASAQARLALVRDELQRGTITPEQAITRMDQLRFAWRGDSFEQGLLFDLARLYLAGGRYREGLEALRMGTSYFRPSEQTRAMAQALDQTFRKLFLEGEADRLEPIQALAVYYDYRELTPLGAEGDALIRRLTQRLVEVELFDRAAGLLEHQVKYRLEGPAQSQVAARLAMVHLLARQPEKAIAAMRATRSIPVPADVLTMRNQIEARALIDLDRTADAEALIEDDRSRMADLLRLDISWKQKDWETLAAVADRLLRERVSDGARLSLDETRTVMRQALAVSMLTDTARAARMRTAFSDRLAGGPYEEAFTLLVSGAQMTPRQVDGLSQTLQSVDQLDSFLNAYRAAFQGPNGAVSPATGPATAPATPAAQRAAAAAAPPPPA